MSSAVSFSTRSNRSFIAHILTLSHRRSKRWRVPLDSSPHQRLHAPRHLVEILDAFAELAEGILDHHEIESGDDHVIPFAADAADGYIEHGHDLFAERLFRVERDGAVELLAFGVAGVV